MTWHSIQRAVARFTTHHGLYSLSGVSGGLRHYLLMRAGAVVLEALCWAENAEHDARVRLAYAVHPGHEVGLEVIDDCLVKSLDGMKMPCSREMSAALALEVLGDDIARVDPSLIVEIRRREELRGLLLHALLDPEARRAVGADTSSVTAADLCALVQHCGWQIRPQDAAKMAEMLGLDVEPPKEQCPIAGANGERCLAKVGHADRLLGGLWMHYGKLGPFPPYMLRCFDCQRDLDSLPGSMCRTPKAHVWSLPGIDEARPKHPRTS